MLGCIACTKNSKLNAMDNMGFITTHKGRDNSDARVLQK